MEDFSDSLVELVKIIKKQRGESDSSDFEMEMENIVTKIGDWVGIVIQSLTCDFS